MPVRSVVTLLIGLLGCQAVPEIELSTAERWNRERDARASHNVRDEHPPSPQFERWLELTAELTITEIEDFRPTRCAVSSDHTVYFANRRDNRLRLWTPRTQKYAPLALSLESDLRAPAALAWSFSDDLLLVLDVGRNRIVRFNSANGSADYIPLNGGQSGFAIAGMPDGRFVVGGERWESNRELSLLARYYPNGRLETTMVHRTSDLESESDHIHAPVLLASDESGALFISEPTLYEIREIDPDGKVRLAFGARPEGYLTPKPIPTGMVSFDQMEAWRAAWTPHVFLHVADGMVFSSFEVRHPSLGYRMIVYSVDGSLVATNLYSESQPLCGRGDRLYMVWDGGTEVRLREYRFRRDYGSGSAH